MKKCIECQRELEDKCFEGNRKKCYTCRNKQQYAKNRTTKLACNKRWRMSHKEYILEKNRKYRARDGGKKHREYSRQADYKLKLEVFHAYAGEVIKCANCPENDMACLSIDHINGDGAEHRKKIGSNNVYRDLKKRGFPSGHQVLCMNCQFKKRAANHEYCKRKD